MRFCFTKFLDLAQFAVEWKYTLVVGTCHHRDDYFQLKFQR